MFFLRFAVLQSLHAEISFPPVAPAAPLPMSTYPFGESYHPKLPVVCVCVWVGGCVGVWNESEIIAIKKKTKIFNDTYKNESVAFYMPESYPSLYRVDRNLSHNTFLPDRNSQTRHETV